jgi:hypothetical protein
MRQLKKELWPYKVRYGVDDSNIKIIEVENWLGENLGVFKDRWNVVYQFSHTDFYFRNGRDATMFMLRWS